MAMNKITQKGQQLLPSGSPAGLASGAPGRSRAPLAGLAGAPLPLVLSLLWYFIHSCGFPHVIFTLYLI